jgi:hypothetical protein
MLGVKTARLERLVKSLEHMTYPFDGDCQLAPNGDPYITLVSSGIKPEGASTDFKLTESDAVDSFTEQLGTYIGQHKGTLYWRIRPTLIRSEYEYPWDFDGRKYRARKRTKQYTVRCRLLRADTPLVSWVMCDEPKGGTNNVA